MPAYNAMFYSPSLPLNLNLEAISGICGSISIACWVVVFSPQIIENFRRKSADGLSFAFIIIWLVGDIFNIVGSIQQHVLPTMIILAFYYTVADLVLIAQVWWYKGFTLKDEEVESVDSESSVESTERRPLLGSRHASIDRGSDLGRHSRSRSISTIRRHLASVDGTHLSPATPLLKAQKRDDPLAMPRGKAKTTLQKFVFNTSAILLVCVAGTFGWWISTQASSHIRHMTENDGLRGKLPEFDVSGQIFGYLCAVFYLGSRVPQLLLNYRRKSTEGVSLLFFLFASLGNLTYDFSIFAFDPSPYCQAGPVSCEAGEQRAVYMRYIAVNASWIVGSLGTLFLDGIIFVQFFLYRKVEEEPDKEEWIDNYLSERETRGRTIEARHI